MTSLPSPPVRPAERIAAPGPGFAWRVARRPGGLARGAGCTGQGCHARTFPCSLGRTGRSSRLACRGRAWHNGSRLAGVLAVAFCPPWFYNDVRVWRYCSCLARRSQAGGSAVALCASSRLRPTRASSGRRSVALAAQVKRKPLGRFALIHTGVKEYQCPK